MSSVRPRGKRADKNNKALASHSLLANAGLAIDMTTNSDFDPSWIAGKHEIQPDLSRYPAQGS
jgi:hypothetical protein